MRQKIIAGNWKMNKTPTQARALAQEIVQWGAQITDRQIILCPPFPALTTVAAVIQGSAVKLGAQDLHWEAPGAFTGKVSADMLKDCGVEYVIIGHSEQRQYFGETNETVNKKVKAALAQGLKPIICAGETLSERESGQTETVVESHIRGAYQGITKDQARQTVIAYEPVWAIGTGKNATPAMAQAVHFFIRKLLGKIYDTSTAEALPIQYGGSMKPENAKELLAQPDIDGGLIGGASLKSDSFKDIVLAY